MAKTTTKSSPVFSILVKTLWIGFLTGVLLLVLYVFSVSGNFFNLFGKMPSLEVLENPKSEVASELYTSDNVILGKYFRENRTPVAYEKLSPNLINALTATEDIRFEEHSGIDMLGTFAIFWYKIKGQNRGSSTISQQLAKNLFKTRGVLYEGKFKNMLVVKTKEWITAIKIERAYTKKEILTMYLNTVDFGSNAFGIEVAARTFFATSPDSLDVPQSAMLIGVLKAPTFYSPVNNPDTAFMRRNTVIDQMVKYKFLTEAQGSEIKQKPIALKYSVENHNKGLATYFRSVITNYLMSWARERGIDIFADGLKIYCTLDSRMQAYAEQAVNTHMKEEQRKFFEHWKGRAPWSDEKGREIPNFIKNAAKRTDRYRNLKEAYGNDSTKIWKIMNTKVKMKVFTWNGDKDTLISPMDSIRYYKHFLHTGFMAMDPHTGFIKAWVGGIDHKHFKYDHVKQGRRQPGSTFKPIVYAAAIDMGYSPCYELPDLPVTFPTHDANQTWSPQNSDGKFTGELFNLRKALANSINSITANLIKEVGPATVVKYAQRMGITSPLDPVPALCLGVSDVSMYELIGAYSTFVNKGFWTEPFYITRIEDKDGNILQDFVPKTLEVFDEETAYLMVHMLKGATEEKGGTALGLNKYGLLWQGYEIGGKTGTTQNYSDGWFIGITPKLVAGAWVGGDDRSIHFRTMDLGQGARMAMPIWAMFIKKVFDDKSLGLLKERFPRPAKLSVEIDCRRYKEQVQSSSDSLQHKTNVKPPDDFL